MIIWTLNSPLKFSCQKCLTGHRSTKCEHVFGRELLEIQGKGRPITQCGFCRVKRKEGGKSHHKCVCGDDNFGAGGKKKLKMLCSDGTSLIFFAEEAEVRRVVEDVGGVLLKIDRGKSKTSASVDEGNASSDSGTPKPKNLSISEAVVQFQHLYVLDDMLEQAAERMRENPCRCKYDGNCICSELPARSRKKSSIAPVMDSQNPPLMQHTFISHPNAPPAQQFTASPNPNPFPHQNHSHFPPQQVQQVYPHYPPNFPPQSLHNPHFPAHVYVEQPIPALHHRPLHPEPQETHIRSYIIPPNYEQVHTRFNQPQNYPGMYPASPANQWFPPHQLVYHQLPNQMSSSSSHKPDTNQPVDPSHPRLINYGNLSNPNLQFDQYRTLQESPNQSPQSHSRTVVPASNQSLINSGNEINDDTHPENCQCGCKCAKPVDVDACDCTNDAKCCEHETETIKKSCCQNSSEDEDEGGCFCGDGGCCSGRGCGCGDQGDCGCAGDEEEDENTGGCGCSH